MALDEIGKFIKIKRKEKSLTQQELADKLSVSFKTVSKWECGKGLPDVSLMIPLCEILGITVNELLSARHIEKDEYMKKADENLVNVLSERQGNKRRMTALVILGIASLLCSLSLFFIAGYVEMEEWCRILIIVFGFVILFLQLFTICFLDNDIGYFECQHCGNRFKPKYWAYVLAPHTLTRRLLKCPKCGKRTNCKKKFAKTDEN